MARSAPHVVSTRLTPQQLIAVTGVATSRGQSLASVAASALIGLTARGGLKTDKLLQDLLEALGIDASIATPDEAFQALRPLLEDMLAPAPEGDALTEVAEPAPPPGFTALSKTEQDYCTRHKLTADQFAARKAGAVRRAGEGTRAIAHSAAPARAAAPAQVLPLTAAQIAHCDRAGIAGPERRKYLADRAAKAVRKAT